MFQTLIVNPIIAALVGLNGLVGSYGLAIILLTLIVKLITLPLTVQQLRATKEMQKLQPELQALQKKHKSNREKVTQETMALYKEHGVNPLSGCLPLVVQMPVWIGLYRALLNMARSGQLEGGFLWIPSLALPQGIPPLVPASWPFFVLPILTVVSQYIVQKMTTPPATDPQSNVMAQMMMIMPVMFGFFALQVPSGLALYWVTTNLFTLVQQGFVSGWDSLKFWEPAGGAANPSSNPEGADEPAAAPASGGAKSGRRKRSKKR